MGLLISNCLKGVYEDLPFNPNPYRKTGSRQTQLQTLLADKENPDVDGRKLATSQASAEPISPWGRPSTPQGAEDSPGTLTPSGGPGFMFGQQSTSCSSPGTATGPPNFSRERSRKVSFNFQSNKSDKNNT